MMARWRNAMLGCLVTMALLLLSAGLAAEPAGKRVDIATLAGPDEPTVAVSLDDPVYKKAKRFEGHALSGLLRKAWPDADRWAMEGAELVFHCADGYSPSMDLARALSGDGIVVTRDLDRPVSDPWEPFLHGKETITPAPFYLVWRAVDPNNPNYKWPYQLVSLSVDNFDRRHADATPGIEASDDARYGFRLFVQNCATCHSINLAGGDLAPELNVPRNVTEYWSSEHLANFIKAPESYRARSKMPNFSHLADGERAAILAYLVAMRSRKICPTGASC